MTLSAEEEQRIYAADIAELYQEALQYEELNKAFSKKIATTKDGINLKIPIVYFIEGWIQNYPENNRSSIPSFGKYTPQEVQDEKFNRMKILREIIIEVLGTNDAPTKSWLP